jgi:hypothetical protein
VKIGDLCIPCLAINLRCFLFETPSPSDDEQASSSTTSKSAKSPLKRSRTPEISNDTVDEDEQPTTQKYNFSMSVDELSDMEKEVNDFCNEDEDDDDDDDDDDSNKIQSRPTKQQRTSSFTPITTTDNPDEDDYNSDSSSSQKLRDLILGKKHEPDSDEESLGDDDIPRGWKTNQKTRKRRS